MIVRQSELLVCEQDSLKGNFWKFSFLVDGWMDGWTLTGAFKYTVCQNPSLQKCDTRRKHKHKLP